MYIKVNARKIENEDLSLKAVATLNIGELYVVKDIKIVEGKNGLFVAMPSVAFQDEKEEISYTDVFHPTNKEAREALYDAIIEAYNSGKEVKIENAEENSYQHTDVYLLKDQSKKIKATATVLIDNNFVVKNIKVIEGEKGLFVAMPSREYTDTNGEKKYVDIFFPSNKESYASFTQGILEKYEAAKEHAKNKKYSKSK